MNSRHLVRLGSAALVFGVVTTAVAGSLLVATIPASASTAAAAGSAPSATTSNATGSAVSTTWTAAQAALGDQGSAGSGAADPDASDFSSMAFTVSQTQNLVDQGITVSWTGAKPTSPAEYATNYLQIMQCWGDEATGPSPEQCEWGAPSASISALMGVNTAKRDLVVGDDPLEDPTLTGAKADPDYLLDPPVTNPFQKAYRVPFRAVDGTLAKSTVDLSKQFDATTTNEVSAARTAGDGSGQVTFETQTGLEAPQLGCGEDDTVGRVTSPRSCWLVIVPRGSHNLDGSASTSTAAGRVTGSPLSETAWRDRVVVRLGFRSVAQSCPIGNKEQRLVGSETITEAITSWQPALCGLGTTYGFSQIGDDEAHHQIVSTIDGASRLAIVNDPLDAATSGGTAIDYAPVAQSAIVVAFTIDYRLYPNAPAHSRDGLQALDLTLNARLVAKLLTQSYQADVPGRAAGDAVVKANPTSIVTDPEFLALNPTFVDSKSDTAPAGLMVALGNANANARVWAWLRADPDADSFLKGHADEWGMRINPSYLPLDLGTDATVDSFPKADLTIAKGGDPDETGYGTLDMRPYMNDMHEGAYRTLKADPNEKDSWNPYGQPKGYTSLGAQIPGSRFLLSITDAASAARYGLPTAKLVNGAGEAVAPTSDSIAKGIATMKQSEVPGVLVADPTSEASGAYPLSMISYAAVNVCAATSQQRADYAKFIDYAAGRGQTPGEAKGDLPDGYVPLSQAMEQGATKVAAQLTDSKAVAAQCPAATVPPAAATSPQTSTAPVADTSGSGTDAGATDVAPADTGTTGGQAAAPATVSGDVDEAAPLNQRTKDQPLSATRLGLAGALGAGIPALGIGPFLIRRGRRLAQLAAALV
ncbi:hypothetical protein [Frondihabitans australicus]|uniref:ABC-type phosphate transport system substrate-binding protein n=1 Tax=Frondihabitans australicus TaxID=386892 RepID=A0A495IDT2_9MICO|nr:hypothetical protein [Frondihabitans australicus]RKR73166.1 hypothetical protein C8E83_0255 [Frondihabitans australicus]